MNGLEVARKIHQVKPGLPIILVSGFTASLNEQDLRKAGISERIEKPVSLASLGEALQRVLGGSGPRSGSKQET
jgi:CheY-like chemotaxis protein